MGESFVEKILRKTIWKRQKNFAAYPIAKIYQHQYKMHTTGWYSSGIGANSRYPFRFPITWKKLRLFSAMFRQSFARKIGNFMSDANFILAKTIKKDMLIIVKYWVKEDYLRTWSRNKFLKFLFGKFWAKA